MKKLEKFVVPVNVIVYGEDVDDAISYVEEALDSSSFITEDGLIGAEVMADDVELFEEGYEDDDADYEDED
jgi:hypothetical protein